MNVALEKLRDSLACVTYSGDKHTNAKIKEQDPLAKLKTVNILAQNGDWFIFNPDKGRGKPPRMSPLLTVSNSHQHHRACDAVIVVLQDQVLRLIFIDLKSTSVSGYSGQFQSTRQFTRYLLGLLYEFHTLEFPTIKERFIIFHTSNSKKVLLNKRPTIFRCMNRPSHDPRNPQKEIVPDGVKLYLKQLLA